MATEWSNEEIEGFVNATFPGLTLFYRDADLSQVCSSKYKVGQIIKERGMTDCTPRGGGLLKQHRYLIASNSAKDLSMFSPTPEQRLCVIMAGAFYKVLDIYEKDGKTQIFLLNVPDDAVDFFSKTKLNLEDDIIAKARGSLDQKINAPAVDAVNTPAWYDRTKDPLGMDDEGNIFSLD